MPITFYWINVKSNSCKTNDPYNKIMDGPKDQSSFNHYNKLCRLVGICIREQLWLKYVDTCITVNFIVAEFKLSKILIELSKMEFYLTWNVIELSRNALLFYLSNNLLKLTLNTLKLTLNTLKLTLNTLKLTLNTLELTLNIWS